MYMYSVQLLTDRNYYTYKLYVCNHSNTFVNLLLQGTACGVIKRLFHHCWRRLLITDNVPRADVAPAPAASPLD